MESSNCVYNVSSVDSTLEALESNSTLAIVELVITCPNVCYIVFGNGNPDLAGIGLFVSYCIQLGLVGISTLLYLAMYYKKTSTSQDVHSRRRNRISKAQSVLAETTAYLTTTVVISCVALAYQTHTAYEHMLITTLAPLQIYLYILHVFTRVAPLHSEAEYAEYDREATFHLVYLFVDIALLIAIRDIPHMNTLCKIILTCDPSQLAQRTPYKVPITTTETHVAIALTFTLWLLLRKRIREGWAAAASSPSTSTLIGDETDRIRRRRILNKIVGAIHQSEKVTIEVFRILTIHVLIYTGYSVILMPVIFFLSQAFANCKPRFPAQIVSLADDCEQCLVKLAVRLHLIDPRRLLFATLLLWPIWNVVYWFKLVKLMRDTLRLQETLGTENEWGVGQVAAVVAWIPLGTQIIRWLWEWGKARKAKTTAILPVAIRHADQAQLILRVGSPVGPTTRASPTPRLGQTVGEVGHSTPVPGQIEHPFVKIRARTWSSG